MTDLSNDYRDLALAVQGLSFLESGITDPLNQFSNTSLEFSHLLKANVSNVSYCARGVTYPARPGSG